MKKQILLISTPFWDVYTPFSALPCLVSQLKADGFDVRQFDLNIEYFNEFLKTYQVDCLHGAILCIPLYRQLFSRLDISFLNRLDNEIAQNFNIRLAAKTSLFDLSIDSVNELIEDQNVRKRLTDFFVTSDAYRQIGEIPALVGFSIGTPEQFAVACLYCKLTREKSPESKIVLGGAYISYLVNFEEKKKLEKVFDICDFLVHGEGETAISKLADFCVNESGTLESINNLCYIANSDIRINPPLLEDVEQLPPPCYEDINPDLYLMPEYMVAYCTSRGCFWGKCAFCSHEESYRGNYRNKSPKKIVDELVSMKQRYGFNHVQFADEAIEPRQFEALVDEMDRREDFIDLKWLCYLRVSSHYTDEVVAKARKNGCEMVFFGVETFNERLSKLIMKGINVKKIGENLCVFKKNSIKIHIWMMVGLPSQTKEEGMEDIENIKALSGYIDSISISKFKLEKTTDMYRNPAKYNITSIDNANKTFSSHKDNIQINTQEIANALTREYRPLSEIVAKSKKRYIIYFWNKENVNNEADSRLAFEAEKIVNKISVEQLLLSRKQNDNLFAKLRKEVQMVTKQQHEGSKKHSILYKIALRAKKMLNRG